VRERKGCSSEKRVPGSRLRLLALVNDRRKGKKKQRKGKARFTQSRGGEKVKMRQGRKKDGWESLSWPTHIVFHLGSRGGEGLETKKEERRVTTGHLPIRRRSYLEVIQFSRKRGRRRGKKDACWGFAPARGGKDAS